MKQGFWIKMKEVSLRDVLHIFLFLLAYPIALLYSRKRRYLMLICENAYKAADNGYWLFRYIRKNEPQEDAVYAIKRKSKDYEKVSTLGPVVEYGSFKHWIYYLTAEKNISTQKGGKPNAAVCYLLEVYGILKNKRIFLQHGITMNKVTFLFYQHSKIGMFVCATEKEYQYVIDNFGYPKDNVKLLGFCRFDNLHNQKTNPKQIIIMPTWRSWISPPSDEETSSDKDIDFENSEYYKQWQGLLDDEELLAYIEKNEIQIIFYPHRKMQKFVQTFHANSMQITIAQEQKYDVQELLISGALLITDYSSVSMDFAYMKKPLLYFQFDIEQFREAHYQEGYFSYERDGFGPVCSNRQELLKEIERFADKEFANDDRYIERHKQFFTLYDEENCRRNYEAIRDY